MNPEPAQLMLTEIEAHHLSQAPVLAVSGWSGSGKTTAMVALVGELSADGLRIGVVKHDVHGDDDRPGSDTDLITRAGASCTVLITPRDRVTRTATQPSALSSTVLQLLATNDVVLLEGFKREPVAKVWLEHPSQQKPPPDLSHVIATLPWTSNRSDHLIPIVRRWFDTTWHRRSVFGGVLIGGRSRRMGQPKQLMEYGGQSFFERVHRKLAAVTDRVIALGDGSLPAAVDVPRLPDAVDANGPMAGIVAALRWAPHAAWLIAACDLPLLSEDALRWMLSQRAPGRWAVLPRLSPDGPLQPLLALYEPHSRRPLEELVRRRQLAPRHLVGRIPVATPRPPDALHHAWSNVNTPAELATLCDLIR